MRDKIRIRPLRQLVLGIFSSAQGISGAVGKTEKILIFAFHRRHFNA
jgi:hypothetical protein